MSEPKFNVKYFNHLRKVWIYGIKAKPDEIKNRLTLFDPSKVVWAHWHYPSPDSHISFGWIDATLVEYIKTQRNLPEWW